MESRRRKAKKNFVFPNRGTTTLFQISIVHDVFGQGYNKLLDEIERNQSRFHRPPIGPLGIHLELPDDRWAVAIEGALGNLFGNFILHDEHDQQEFFNCCRRAQVRFPSCQVSSFDRRRIHISPQNIDANVYAALMLLFSVPQISPNTLMQTSMQH